MQQARAAFGAGLCALPLVIAACASSEAPAATGGSGGSGGAAAATSGSSSSASGTGGVDLDAGGTGGAPAGPAVLYAHTNTTLYRGDPAVEPLTMEIIGDFDCIGGAGQETSMTDIAVDADGVIWAVSGLSFYRIELQDSVVHCAETFPLNNPQDIRFYGLGFAPKGVFAPDREVLVAGNSAGELYTIDADGTLEQHGRFGTVPADDGNGHAYPNAGKAWELSGDIVFLANAGDPIGFATVRDCPNPPSTTGCNATDTLIELNVAALPGASTGTITKSVRGQIVHRNGCPDASPGYGGVYGVTAWQTKVFGFSRSLGDGYAIDIDNTDGTACLLQAYAGNTWAGAGITTLAPVVPPPPK